MNIFNVVDGKLIHTKKETVNTGSKNFFKIQIQFDNSWEEFTKLRFLEFYQNKDGEHYKVKIGEENVATANIPTKVLKSNLPIYVSVVGENYDSTIIANTEFLPINIKYGGNSNVENSIVVEQEDSDMFSILATDKSVRYLRIRNNILEYSKDNKNWYKISGSGNSGGGTGENIELDNYYTKDQTYSKDQIDEKNKTTLQFAKEYTDQKVAESGGCGDVDLSNAVKESLTTPTETWTTEEMTSACKTIGALSLESEKETWLAGQVTLYGTVRDSQGYPSYARQYVTNNPVAGRVPRWSGRTTLLTNEPQEDLDCANKKYVDDLFATSGGITEDDLNTAISTAKEEILEDANDYTDTAVETTLKQANKYTDDKIAELNSSGGAGGTVESATKGEIQEQESTTKVITPSNLTDAVKEGLAYPKEKWVYDEQEAARKTLGLSQATDKDISNQSNNLQPITPAKVAYTVYVGLTAPKNNYWTNYEDQEKACGYLGTYTKAEVDTMIRELKTKLGLS